MAAKAVSRATGGCYQSGIVCKGMLVTSRRAGWSLRVTLVVVVMFVLQSVASAFALGSGPDPAQLDAFGNPLCITSVDHTDPAKGGDHGKLPNCCTLGCPMVGQALGAPPQPAWLAAELVLDLGTTMPVPHCPAIAKGSHQPGNPRAPPQIG